MSGTSTKYEFNPDEEFSKESILTVFKEHFTEYASYVILDRAVPHTWDGLKPVQRRILHSLNEMDDGRFNKVANVVGHTMRYHPHGDMAISEALVNLANKDLLIERQGNFGDPFVTGFKAASARYIEARLSPLAKKIMFNKKLTSYSPSYDGRSNEPVQFPAKFPLVLAQGVEGIAVGLSTKILPHNFNELIEASINYLRNKPFQILPDFPTGALMDASLYNDGKKGGRIKLRCTYDIKSDSEISITSLPYECTTESLIESIVKANESGKIKLKKVEDRSSENVDIRIHLDRNTKAASIIKPLYAFTKAEYPISVNACIIDVNDKPIFTSVSEILKSSTERTKSLIKLELEIKISELKEKLYFLSLEALFINNKIYQVLEKSEDWEEALQSVLKKMKPLTKDLYRPIKIEDVEKLCDLKIKRISKFDVNKSEELYGKTTEELESTEEELSNLTSTVVKFYKSLKKEFGKKKPRKTEICDSFDVINKVAVVNENLKLFIDKTNGFIGFGSPMKKEEFVGSCSELSNVFIIFKDGISTVIKAEEKVYIGRKKGSKHIPIVFCGVLKPNDEITCYNILYIDKDSSKIYGKRFLMDKGFTRGKDYPLLKSEGSQILYLDVTDSPIEKEAPDPLILFHKEKPRIKKQIEFSFSEIAIKNKTAVGNIVTPYMLKKIKKLVLTRDEEG